MNQYTKTKKLTAVAMMCAISYLMVVFGRVPIVMFLSYEPKDVIITIGGFIFGPWTAMVIAVIVCFIEMISITSTGMIGFIMNVLASCAFACLASWNYKRNHTIRGAAAGLFMGVIASTIAMLLWNYLLTPYYMGYPRETIAAMLVPVFLPFNLFKGGLNMAITLLLYKPIVTALRKSGLVPPSTHNAKHQMMGTAIFAFITILTCILLFLSMTGLVLTGKTL